MGIVICGCCEKEGEAVVLNGNIRPPLDWYFGKATDNIYRIACSPECVKKLPYPEGEDVRMERIPRREVIEVAPLMYYRPTT
jgi:hypothetical protein